MYELSKIPEQIAGSETYKKDPEGNIRWIGASISSFGFTVNHDVLNRYRVPKPLKWEDLAKPDYARYLPTTPLIAIADPTMSTSNARIFEIILQAKGWEEGWRILTPLAANSIVYPGSGDARDAVIRGDVAIATTIDFYGYMAMNVNPSCEYIAPEGETIVSPEPIALLVTTKYPVHAAAFVAWVLSEFGGQQIWLDKEINRIPINPYVFDTPEGQERLDLKQAFEKIRETSSMLFNETLSTLWIDAVINYFKATLVDVHDELQYTWAEMAKAYLEGNITRDHLEYLIGELSKPLTFTDPLTGEQVSFTLEYAVKIGKYMSNKSIADALRDAWINGAKERYQYVRQLLQLMLNTTVIILTTTRTITSTVTITHIITSTQTTTRTLRETTTNTVTTTNIETTTTTETGTVTTKSLVKTTITETVVSPFTITASTSTTTVVVHDVGVVYATIAANVIVVLAAIYLLRRKG
jgi:ABC-type Fe3+ transport system substrate-binding protein